MIITPKQPRNGRTVSRLSKLVPYMLRGKGEERCTWYMAGNLPGLDRREDAELAVGVMELLQQGNREGEGQQDLPSRHLVSPGGPAPNVGGARGRRSPVCPGGGPGATPVHRSSPQRAGARASSRGSEQDSSGDAEDPSPLQSHPRVSGSCERRSKKSSACTALTEREVVLRTTRRATSRRIGASRVSPAGRGRTSARPRRLTALRLGRLFMKS